MDKPYQTSTATSEALPAAPPSLLVTVAVAVVAFGISLVDVTNDARSPFYGQTFSGLSIAAALGASMAFPTLHVLIASLVKSQRNARSRRRTYIGWSILVIVVQSLTLLTRQAP